MWRDFRATSAGSDGIGHCRRCEATERTRRGSERAAQRATKHSHGATQCATNHSHGTTQRATSRGSDGDGTR